MTRLSGEALAKADAFVRTHGREVEQRTLDVLFGNGSADAVCDALAAYQNKDGGFGNGLEPDIRATASSARTTTFGLQMCRDVGASGEHPVVRAAVRYLIETFDADRQVWPIVPPEVEEAPHAPWWDYAGTGDAFKGFVLNPTADAVACLLAFPEAAGTSLAEELIPVIVSRVEASPDAMEMHDLQCAIRLTETAAVPADARSRLEQKLIRVAEAEVSRDPGSWGTYSLKPLNVVFSPGSFLAPTFAPDLDANLDHEIAQQGEDGAWSPPWTWGGSHQEAWEKAKVEWQSWLTVEALKLLKTFDRIEK